MCFDVMQQRGSIARTVSSNICDRIDPCSLAAMQGASCRWAAAARRSALASEKVAFAQVLWRSTGGGDVHDRRHDRECDLYSGAVSVIVVGGNRCFHWSIMGKQEQGSGDSMIFAMLFCEALTIEAPLALTSLKNKAPAKRCVCLVCCGKPAKGLVGHEAHAIHMARGTSVVEDCCRIRTARA